MVASLSGTCSVTKSATASSSSRVATALLFPIGICTGALVRKVRAPELNDRQRSYADRNVMSCAKSAHVHITIKLEKVVHLCGNVKELDLHAQHLGENTDL